MKTKEYKYDVAFSFLKEDENVVQHINTLLEGRLSTFLYSKKQEEIAGTDGETTFNKVFGEEARIVAVFYRSTWGNTPWTRIEQTAIKNRAYDNGYDFLILIPLEDTPPAPKWLPKTNIWIGLKRWGIEGAASVIEARAQQEGSKPHEDTIHQRAARLKKQIDGEKERQQVLHSEEGANLAQKEFSKIQTILESLTRKIAQETGLTISLTHKKEREFDLRVNEFYVAVDWSIQWANSLEYSKMRVSVWKGPPPRAGRFFVDKKYSLMKEEFDFDIDTGKNPCWKNDKIFSTENIAEYFIELLINHVKEKIEENN